MKAKYVVCIFPEGTKGICLGRFVFNAVRQTMGEIVGFRVVADGIEVKIALYRPIDVELFAETSDGTIIGNE